MLGRVRKRPGGSLLHGPVNPRCAVLLESEPSVTDLLFTPRATTVTTVLVCEEEPDARGLLTGLLTAGVSVDVLAAVADGFGVVDAFTITPADVVLIGVHRGSGAGSAAMDLLLGLHPAAAVVVFGGPVDAALLTAAVTRGARGLMIWDTHHPYRAVTRPGWTADRPRSVRLTEREVRILQGMSRGRSNREIGRELSLSEDTVKTNARGLFGKLGARDRAHAVAIGLRTGLLT